MEKRSYKKYTVEYSGTSSIDGQPYVDPYGFPTSPLQTFIAAEGETIKVFNNRKRQLMEIWL